MKIDPRCKLLLFLIVLVGIFLLKTTFSQLILAGLVLLLGMTLKISPLEIYRKVKFIRFIVPLTFILQIFFTVVGNWDYLTSSKVYYDAIFYSLRMANFLIVVGLSSHLISLTEVIDATYHILKPLRRLKFPVDELFLMIFIAIRFFPEVRLHYQRIAASMDSFLSKPKNFRQRIERLAETLVPVMIVSFRKAEIMAEAMVVRGYVPGKPRSYYIQLDWSLRETLLLLLGILTLIILAGIR